MSRLLLALSAAVAVSCATAHAAPRAVVRQVPKSVQVGEVVVLRAAKCRGCAYRWTVRRAGAEKVATGSRRRLRLRLRSAGTHRVRLKVTDRAGRKRTRVRSIRVLRAPEPQPVPPPAQEADRPAAPAPGAGSLGQPSCEPGAASASTAGEVRAAVRAGRDVCVVEPVGDVDLDDLTSPTRRFVGTSGSGSMGAISLDSSSNITFRARFRSIYIRFSPDITIEQSVVGGTSSARVLDQLIFVPDKSDDLTIRDSVIGWTTADNTGNTGYGIRAWRDSDRMRIERNRFHHIGADAIQLGLDGSDTVVDRNEIAYVAQPPSSDEHSDDIQITGNGPNMRITNNYLHHNGWFDETTRTGGSGPYIHAGTTNSLLFENNLVRHNRNFMQVGSLGTGGCARSNLTFRRNTFADNGTMWPGAPDMAWNLCSGSADNLYERNVVNDRFGQDHPFSASATTARDNLHGGSYAIDPSGHCTSAACNPAGQEPIGYRKPAGVHW